MKKLFGALLFMVLAVMLIPVVQNSVDTYDTINTSESVVWDTSVNPINFGTCNETVVFNSVTVDGVDVTSDIIGGSYLDPDDCTGKTEYDIEFDAGFDNGDILIINYSYTLDMPTGVDGLMNVVLIIFVIGIVVGGVAYIKFN